MVRRLGRREQPPPPQSVRLQEPSLALPDEDAGSGSRKKSPGQDATLAARLSAYVKAANPHQIFKNITDEISRTFGHLKPWQLNQTMVDGIISRWKRDYAPTTTHRHLGCFRQLQPMLTSIGVPPFKVAKMRKPSARAVTATHADIEKALAAAAPDIRLFILLCWHLALRFSEALAVTPASWNEQDQTITIAVKGHQTRTIPVTPEVEAYLRIAKRDAGDPHESCISILNGRPITPAGVRNSWRSLVKKIGVPHLHPHDMRRTTATNLYRATHDLRAVQQYLGHASLASTIHYIAPLATENLRGLQNELLFLKPSTEVKQ